MASLECVRVYHRRYSDSSSTIVYDKSSGTGSLSSYTSLGSANNTSSYDNHFYLRVYKYTATDYNKRRFTFSLGGTGVSDSTTQSSDNFYFSVAVSSSMDYFSSFGPGSSGSRSFTCSRNTNGPTGKLSGSLTISGSGTWYIGVWLQTSIPSGEKIYWTGLSDYMTMTCADAYYSSSTSTPTEGGTFAVTVSFFESLLPWKYKLSSFSSSSSSYESSQQSTVTSSSITVPSSWFAGSSSSTVTATLSLYTLIDGSWVSSSDTTKTLSFYSSAAFAPTIAAGAFSEVVPVNTGSIDKFIVTLSGVRATIDTSYITCQSGSTLSSISCSLNGTAMSRSGSVFTSGVIATTDCKLKLTATDSVGRSSSREYTIAVYSYVKPSLYNAGAYRCDASGTASKTGTHFRATARQTVKSPIGTVTNTATTHVYLLSGATSTELANLPDSATETEYSGLSASGTYSVKLIVTDLAGGSSEPLIIDLSYEEWLFCANSTGGGCAIGKAAEYDDTLEIPSDWVLQSGDMQLGRNIFKLVSGYHYGTSAPSGTGENGEVYFKLSSSGTGWISATPYIYVSS